MSKKYNRDEEVYWRIIELIKEIELLYALSNDIPKRRCQYIKDRFKKIWKSGQLF